ncbi:Cutinase [Erysiphe neolycopersici]|uniref:cutinase n=1 Tax=Erysiphe neolycopersici TaxID=212602 RepID=A0A420HZF9_9PEZI|nr:Cutinase [Erysiphe neolycopersici]
MKTLKVFPYLVLFGKITALPTEISYLNSGQLQALESSTASNKISARDELSRATANELLDGPCRSVTMLFAKGTGEVGNLGAGSSPGPALSETLKASLGENNIAVQGIDYDANVIGFLIGGDILGSKELIEMTNLAASKCPDSKFVLSGFSQGAQVVHRSVKRLSSEVSSKIRAVVLFGDPSIKENVGDLPESSVLSICNDEDAICHSGLGFEGHKKYAQRAKEAADFIVSKLN